VGPPLNAWSERQYIAGNLQNQPDNLIAWIMNPQAIEPGTAMPNMNIDEQEARDIAAYLYTLESKQSGMWSQGE
jgi:cytochrome c1